MSHFFERVVAAGVKYDSHESDLYIPVNETSIALVEKYEFKHNVSQFISNLDGQRWFDVPFAYQPFWDKKQARL